MGFRGGNFVNYAGIPECIWCVADLTWVVVVGRLYRDLYAEEQFALTVELG